MPIRITAQQLRPAALAAAVLTATLGVTQAYAAASYYNFAEATLTLFGAVADDPSAAAPDHLTMFASPSTSGSKSETGPDAMAFYDPFAGTSVPGLFGEPVYDFYIYAGTDGEAAAAPEPSFATSDAIAGYEIEILNDSFSTGYTISGEISYLLDAEAMAEYPSVEEAYASVAVYLDGLVAGNLLAASTEPTELAVGAGSVDGIFAYDTLTATVPVEFYIGAGMGEVLLFDVTADGAADSTTVVPLPAAAWMFGAAILGMAGFMTRRKA
jgi:hypothetical protein